MIEVKANCKKQKQCKRNKKINSSTEWLGNSPSARFSFLPYETAMFGLVSIFSTFFFNTIGGQCTRILVHSHNESTIFPCPNEKISPRFIKKSFHPKIILYGIPKGFSRAKSWKKIYCNSQSCTFKEIIWSTFLMTYPKESVYPL